MATLPPETIRELLEPYIGTNAPLSDGIVGQISTYLDLLIRWNSRVSLTSIRRPEEMIQRHFGESLFTAVHLTGRLSDGAELLDYGSGAGFPGLPIQMLLPEVRVTLAESQGRKVAFLREVIRTLGLTAVVWPHRVEELPAERRFDAVTMRAVERMSAAVDDAASRVHEHGWMAALVGSAIDVAEAEKLVIPGSEHRRLLLWRKTVT